jgi:hypothetical protein
VLNLRHLTVLQTPKTGQNDTILGVLFVQMHKMGGEAERRGHLQWVGFPRIHGQPALG